MNVLQNILEHKRKEVEARKRIAPRRTLEERDLFSFRRLSLGRALRGNVPAIIAEVKKASPSKGVIRADFDALAIAREYTQNGATALSVLTDEQFFQGDLRFIERMRKFAMIPILRKDFVIDSYQLYETKAYGADAVLLIAAALDRSQLDDLFAEATAIDLECLIEVHSKEEIETLDFDKVTLVGINNRDLATFETDISTSAKLRQLIPKDVEVVSESAISTSDDIQYLMSNGISSFLIGEMFMRAGSPGKALAELLTER
jgi:indole-3-glycerol phosphate synthase